MKYRIGQKVVYIGPDFSLAAQVLLHGFSVPSPKSVYTIRGRRYVNCAGIQCAAYVFEEIHNREYPCLCSGGVCEVHIEEHYLRPLTDISVFERLRKEIEAGGEVHLVRDEVPA